MNLNNHLLTAAIWGVNHIFWLGETRELRAELAVNLFSFFSAQAEMACAFGHIWMMQVIGFDVVDRKFSEKRVKRLDIIIDAFEENRLADERNACLV